MSDEFQEKLFEALEKAGAEPIILPKDKEDDDGSCSECPENAFCLNCNRQAVEDDWEEEYWDEEEEWEEGWEWEYWEEEYWDEEWEEEYWDEEWEEEYWEEEDWEDVD